MCSAASVRSVTGWMTGRENSRPSAAASAVPATHSASSSQRRREQRRVDAREAAAELERAAARRRHRADPHVVAVDHAVVPRRPWPCRPRPRLSRAVTGMPGRASSPTGRADLAGGVEHLHVGRRAAGARRRRRAPGVMTRSRSRGRSGRRRGPHHEPALAAERVVDLRAQLAAHDEVADHRGEHDGDADGAGGQQREPAAQAHQWLPQHVADPAHGVQQPRLAARLGLAPQVADVDAERVGGGAEVVAPHALEQLRAAEHLARVLEEHLQQRELGARQLERALAAPHLVRARVEHEVGEAQVAARTAPRSAAAARAAAPAARAARTA